jgi:hypothetical protein
MIEIVQQDHVRTILGVEDSEQREDDERAVTRVVRRNSSAAIEVEVKLVADDCSEVWGRVRHIGGAKPDPLKWRDELSQRNFNALEGFVIAQLHHRECDRCIFAVSFDIRIGAIAICSSGDLVGTKSIE